MKKILSLSALLFLSACGADNADHSIQPERVATMAAQHADIRAKALTNIPGERKVYDFTWANAQLSGVAKVPGLSDFHVSTPEIRLQDISLSFDKDGMAGQVYRLYQAAFGRVPDVLGFGYWKNAVDNDGLTLRQVATEFLASAESKAIFGMASDDATFLNRLYENVLHRQADAAGANYWLGALKSGMARVDVLLSFTDSPENKSATEAAISKGMAFAEPGIAYTPVSNATGPKDVIAGSDIELDGSLSSDANGDTVRYNWSVSTRPNGSHAAFANPAVSKPHITFDTAGTYELTLWVNDGTLQNYAPEKLTIIAHATVADTGTYTCAALDAATAISMYANGHTYLDRNKDGIPCNAPDIAFENAPTVTPIADTGRYKCSAITHANAILLFLQGNTYLDRDHDGKPCEATDITLENILYPTTPPPPPPVSTPTVGKCWVNGYTRKNGTHVNGYWRSC